MGKVGYQADTIPLSGLDFLDTVKLINYIRSEVQQGKNNPSISRPAFQDDKYLKPVLEDDALLYSFDDLEVEMVETAEDEGQEVSTAQKIQELQDALDKMQLQFAEYKEEVQKTMLSQLQDDVPVLPSQGSTRALLEEGEVKDAQVDVNKPVSNHVGTYEGEKPRQLQSKKDVGDDVAYDDSYFSSYAWNGTYS